MATITETTLVKVKTISKKYLSQITRVEYEWAETGGVKPLFRRLLEGVVEDQTLVVGWLGGESFGRMDSIRHWLVKQAGCLYLIVAPTRGAAYDHVHPGLEQLFID